MSNAFQLQAELRTDVGKGASRRLRKHADLVPAIIYGADKEATPVTFTHKDLMKALENEAFYSHIITISLNGADTSVVLKDLQRHPARKRILHADFMRVSSDHKIRVHVPLHFLNEASCVGVKVGGGAIAHHLVEVEVLCLPKDLPEFIEVDLAGLEMGRSLHLSDLKLPPGTSLTALLLGPSHDASVVSVHGIRGGKQAEGEAAAPAAE